MKKINLFFSSCIGLLFSLIITPAIAQHTFQFAYDNAGNRVQRKIIVTPENERRGRPGTTATGKETDEEKGSTDNAFVDPKLNYTVKVYPNPVQDKLTIEFVDSPTEVVISYYLSDNTGRVLFTKDNVAGRDQVNLAAYQPGVYYLSITDNNKKQYKYKVLKVN